GQRRWAGTLPETADRAGEKALAKASDYSKDFLRSIPNAWRRDFLSVGERTRETHRSEEALACRSDPKVSRSQPKARPALQRLRSLDPGDCSRTSEGSGKGNRARALSRPAARNSLRRKRLARSQRTSNDMGRQALCEPGIRLQRDRDRSSARRGRGDARKSLDDRTRRRNGLSLRLCILAG